MSLLSDVWGRITGADRKQQTPNQQVTAFGRAGDYTVVYPYGLYCDAPDAALAIGLKCDAFMALTQKRPADLARGEPCLFHPETNTRIVPRNDGTLTITAGGNDIVVTAGTVRFESDLIVEGGLTVNGATELNDGLSVSGDTELDGNLETTGSTALGGPGGQPIARAGDPTNGSNIVAGSPTHTAT